MVQIEIQFDDNIPCLDPSVSSDDKPTVCALHIGTNAVHITLYIHYWRRHNPFSVKETQNNIQKDWMSERSKPLFFDIATLTYLLGEQ